MAEKQAESSPKALKRACDENGNDIPISKKFKNDDSLKLDDINNDCLDSIFAYLDLEDLVNVAETSSCFIPSVHSVFSQKYRNKKCVLSSFDLGSDFIVITKSFGVQFFCHFGQYVSDLLVDCLSEEVEEAILTHCTSSLVNLDLAYLTTDCFNTISKPFQSIETLTLSHGMLSQKMSAVNTWFPNLTSLKLLNIKLIDPTCLENQFHSLKELVIHNGKSTLPQSAIEGMLHLNPQVEKLECFQKEYDVSLIRAISEHLPLLKVLVLWTPDDRFWSFRNQQITFESVKKFTLNSYYYRSTESVECMPLHFGKLETLTLDGFNQYQDHLLDFVMQNKDLTKLSIVPEIDEFDDLKIDDFGKIVNALPKLVEFEFCADMFMEDELLSFLNDSKMLEKVRLLFISLPLFATRFQAKLKSEWKNDIDIVDCNCIEHEAHFVIELERKH